MSVSADPSVGSELLGYRIEELIGRGGMGVVFRARDQRLKRNVALKLLAPEFASDERFRERFLRESELAASLDHPNVIPIYEAGEVDERLFLAMRYVEGGDLRDALRAGPLEPGVALDVCSQIGEALDAAHERGLVHRDVKPSNVLLDGHEHAYLADFGLTRQIAGDDVPTVGARSLGSVDYIAPEQLRGEEVDGRADLYSLGCLLYECLTGAPPFRRPSDLAVAFAHLEEEPIPPPRLESLVDRALAKAPEDRYPSARERISAARAALGLDVPHRRSRLVPVAAVVLALIATGTVSILLTRGGSAGASPSGRLLRIDPSSDRVTATRAVGGAPTAVAVGSRHVWISTPRNIWRIDPRTFDAKHFAANQPVGLAVSHGVVYAPERSGGVTRLDATSNETLEGIPGIPPPSIFTGPIASGGNGVWFVEEVNEHGVALRLGKASTIAGKVVRRIRLPDPVPLDEQHVRFDMSGVAVGAQGVWVAGDALDRRLLHLYPGTKRVVPIRLPFSPGGVAVGRGSVWVTGQFADEVARIYPVTNKIRQIIPVGAEPTGVAVGDGSVWVANTLGRSITRIDPNSGQILATIPLKASPRAVTVWQGRVWVAADAD